MIRFLPKIESFNQFESKKVKYVGSHIEEGLELAEEEKERLERLELEQQRAKLKEKKGGDDEGFHEEHIIMMIGTGLGVFQIIAAGSERGIFNFIYVTLWNYK